MEFCPKWPYPLLLIMDAQDAYLLGLLSLGEKQFRLRSTEASRSEGLLARLGHNILDIRI